MLTVIQISVRYVNHQSGYFPIRIFPNNKEGPAGPSFLKNYVLTIFMVRARIWNSEDMYEPS